MSECIRYVEDGPLAWLTLNRPEKLNAINGAMIDELHAALDRAEADDRIRVVVLDGAGRAFSSGFDLDMGPSETEQSDPESLRSATRRELQRDFDIILRFWDSAKPTIAAVHGYCLGSSMEMALACDVTLAASDCRFGAPEVRFGSGIVALLLPWLAGPKRAKELLLGGDDRVSAEQAAAWGLVNRVVEPDALHAAARALALQIARNDPLAVRLTKHAINRTMEAAGMRRALREALEIDVEIETTETEESRAFNDIMRREGARAAIAWRRKRIG